MNKKKLIAILTLVCFMFTLVPVAAMAEDAVTPFEITSSQTLISEVGSLNITGGTAAEPVVLTVNGTVMVNGTINVSSGYVIITGMNDGMLKRAAGNTKDLIGVGNATLIMEDVIIDGGADWESAVPNEDPMTATTPEQLLGYDTSSAKIDADTGSLIEVFKDGTVILNSGAVLQNAFASAQNRTYKDGQAGGAINMNTADANSVVIMNSGSKIWRIRSGHAVYVKAGSQLEMNGGTISHCYGTRVSGDSGNIPAAVRVEGHFVMKKGSVISYNYCKDIAAVTLYGANVSAAITGGEFYYNIAEKGPGALRFHNVKSKNIIVAENLNVHHNVGFGGDGGGIAIRSGKAWLKNCTVTDNKLNSVARDISIGLSGNSYFEKMTVGTVYIEGTSAKAYVLDNSISATNISGLDTDANDTLTVYVGDADSLKKWENFIQKSATIFYVLNGGSMYEQSGTLLDTPVRFGYVFDGWYIDEALTTRNTGSYVRGNTYYAKWTLNEGYVELTFDANDGSDTPATVVKAVKKDEAYTLPTNLFTRAGYTLTGWVDANITITPTENLTLKAQWTLDTPTIDEASGDVSKTYDGESVELSVTTSHVLNDAELSYQWKKGETALTTTSSSLVLAGDVADSGIYTCVVTATDSNDNIATVEQAFTVEITNAVISGITVTGYSGAFDNDDHTITYSIPDGTTIKFTTTTGSAYNLAEAPSYAGVGEYPVYYQVTKGDNYASVEGNVKIVITKATQAIDYATKAITKVVGDAAFTNELERTRVYGTISYESSDETVATIDTVGEVTIVGAGTATITAKAAGSNNYDEKTASYTLTVQPKAEYTPSTSTSSGFSGSYNNLISAPDVDNGDVKLSDSNAVEGENVTATVTPDNGYGVVEVIVTDEDGNIISVEFIGNGQYTFVMPDGEVSIEVVCKPAIIMKIGDTELNIFGKTMQNDVAPTIGEGNRTMLPIRAIANALGADVYWDADNQKVTIVKDGKVIEVFIGKDYAFVDGERIQLDAKAYIENSRTYLQVRFVTEALDAEVIWDPMTRTVIIIPN